MNERIARARARIVPTQIGKVVRRRWYRFRPPHIQVGIGKGLRFDPGPSNIEYAHGSNELPVQEALAANAPVGSVVFDVGANVGYFTVLAARLVGSGGRVIAFEPVVENAEIVRRNLDLNGLTNVDIVVKAVGNATGLADLNLARYSGGAVLASAGSPPDPADTITVEIVSIDDAVAAGDVPAPHVVKIDVEGAELDVLRGMEHTLRIHRPIIIGEVDDANESAVATKLQACIDYLTSQSYEISMLEDSYGEADWEVRHFVASPSSDQ